MGTQAFFRQVLAAIAEADRNGLVSDKGSSVLGGLSGRATVGLLQRLVGLVEDRKSLCYLEIGVFQGLSLLSVAIEHPEFACFGIDNFSILDPKGENLGIVQDRTRRLAATNAHLINRDYEAALEHLPEHIGARKVAVFFIDGAHDYRSQLMALLLIRPYLSERAVIIVDDANYFDVRQSTRDFLVSHPEFKMVFEAYSPGHPANLDDSTRETHEAGWLNGVNVLVLDHENVLPVMLPRVEPLAPRPLRQRVAGPSPPLRRTGAPGPRPRRRRAERKRHGRTDRPHHRRLRQGQGQVRRPSGRPQSALRGTAGPTFHRVGIGYIAPQAPGAASGGLAFAARAAPGLARNSSPSARQAYSQSPPVSGII